MTNCGKWYVYILIASNVYDGGTKQRPICAKSFICASKTKPNLSSIIYNKRQGRNYMVGLL